MRFIAFADPHISDVLNTSQEAAVDWALRTALELKPDALICAGDVTACGNADAAMRFLEKLYALPFPSIVVPGNSELRNVYTAPILERLFSAYPNGLKLGGIRIIGMNFSHDSISPEERKRLSELQSDEKLILVSHQGHRHLDEDSRAFLSSWIAERKKKILIYLTGHIHVQSDVIFEGVREFSLRAIDPDKCVGGLPQLLQVDVDESGLKITEHVFTEGQLCEWSDAEKQEFLNLLGVTCYHPEQDMEEVIRLGIRHMEWRYVSEETLPLLKRWREKVEGTFSLHMPSLTYDGGVRGEESFASCAQNAVDAGADMITVHPPFIKNRFMYKYGAFEKLADSMARALRPVYEAGIKIMVENNHTNFGTSPDVYEREFGCSPVEVMTWRYALDERLGKGACGIRLDIGHARNNVPVSQDYPLGKWYPVMGPYARTYHLHQTVSERGGKMRNHFPITGINDGFIAFCGFLHDWHTGVLTHGPVILEIREGEGAIETYKRLKRIITEGE